MNFFGVNSGVLGSRELCKHLILVQGCSTCISVVSIPEGTECQIHSISELLGSAVTVLPL